MIKVRKMANCNCLLLPRKQLSFWICICDIDCLGRAHLCSIKYRFRFGTGFVYYVRLWIGSSTLINFKNCWCHRLTAATSYAQAFVHIYRYLHIFFLLCLFKFINFCGFSSCLVIIFPKSLLIIFPKVLVGRLGFPCIPSPVCFRWSVRWFRTPPRFFSWIKGVVIVWVFIIIFPRTGIRWTIWFWVD